MSKSLINSTTTLHNQRAYRVPLKANLESWKCESWIPCPLEWWSKTTSSTWYEIKKWSVVVRSEPALGKKRKKLLHPFNNIPITDFALPATAFRPQEACFFAFHWSVVPTSRGWRERKMCLLWVTGSHKRPREKGLGFDQNLHYQTIRPGPKRHQQVDPIFRPPSPSCFLPSRKFCVLSPTTCVCTHLGLRWPAVLGVDPRVSSWHRASKMLLRS